jgi:predicted dehydrogenase
MARKNLNIGLVGYGFMGRTHSNAFLQAPRFFAVPYQPVLKVVCARSAERVKDFAENWGYQSIETDWRALVQRSDIDLIDIASPNDTHAEIAIAAAKAGKMVLCEKPLGRTAAEAKAMTAAVEAANVPNMVWYNAPISCRTGPSPATFPRAVKAYGAWTFPWPAAASPAIYSPITSIWPCG